MQQFLLLIDDVTVSGYIANDDDIFHSVWCRKNHNVGRSIYDFTTATATYTNTS
jgi:hypothetical protein